MIGKFKTKFVQILQSIILIYNRGNCLIIIGDVYQFIIQLTYPLISLEVVLTLTCLLRACWSLWENGHFLQFKGFFSCTPSMCFFKFLFCLAWTKKILSYSYLFSADNKMINYKINSSFLLAPRGLRPVQTKLV